MYSSFQLASKYLSYYLTASNGKGHGIHSPFVFDFIKNVLNDNASYDDYKSIESLRAKLLRDKTVLTIEDLGAGSSAGPSKQRSIGAVTRHAVKSKKYGQLLYRIVKYYQPLTAIELGTSLGLTTSYLARAKAESTIYSLEGSTTISELARKNFEALAVKNVKLVEGNFDYTLPSVLYHLPSIDFVFVDGNHRGKPTLNYFHWLLPKTRQHTILIFDDVHWSREMEGAWKIIKENAAVSCSIDLFFIGIIFFRKEFKEKQHFIIRF
ncbi:MAG TPA: class I SAM-dependent methyltransferase [Chitinophagaceae bacterium]|jgi:predicted O-methyltransferase YrrM